jgi:protein tyrosine/serine phosphatase
LKALAKVSGISISSLGTLAGLYALYLIATHNLHIVSAGKIYRSNQMDNAALAKLVHECGIKTIVNLRGADLNATWYRTETNVSQRLGVKHLDFALSATEEITDAQIDEILTALNCAPKPILIHCRSGADRSGLISALYLYSLEGKPPEVAGRQLSILCGHLPSFLGTGSNAMDRSYRRYVRDHITPSHH